MSALSGWDHAVAPDAVQLATTRACPLPSSRAPSPVRLAPCVPCCRMAQDMMSKMTPEQARHTLCALGCQDSATCRGKLQLAGVAQRAEPLCALLNTPLTRSLSRPIHNCPQMAQMQRQAQNLPPDMMQQAMQQMQASAGLWHSPPLIGLEPPAS